MKNDELLKLGKSVVNYMKQQIEKVEKDHDWSFNMTLKI